MNDSDVAAVLRAARPLIKLALAEDIGPGDATSLATIPADMILHGAMIVKADGVIAGLPVAAEVFRRVDRAIRLDPLCTDGTAVAAGTIVARVHGPGRGILTAERTALNFLQRMSGIATLTARYVAAVAGTQAAILDTRKTVPGFRVLDKYAVRMGGGRNHRLALYDMIMIKDNHVDACGSIVAAVARARAAYPSLPIEVEVRTLDELGQVLSITPPVQQIMLDNMSLNDIRRAVALTAGRVPLECSGGVTLERIGEIAATGVNYISIGALTHSVKALDISLDIRPA